MGVTIIMKAILALMPTAKEVLLQEKIRWIKGKPFQIIRICLIKIQKIKQPRKAKTKTRRERQSKKVQVPQVENEKETKRMQQVVLAQVSMNQLHHRCLTHQQLSN